MLNNIPPVTRGLLIANVTVFLLQVVTGPRLIFTWGLWPPGVTTATGESAFRLWQLVTYSFLHGGFAHLFFNMFALWMFGSEIERVMRRDRYLTYYFVCVIGAAVTQLATSGMFEGPPAPTIGASGGVFGILLAYGLAYPHRRVMLIFPPIPMPAWLFVTLYGLLELYLGITQTAAGIAHFAHLGGMIGGFVLLQYWANRKR
ncbi:MAG TPA: rhomboid family intramembrane serine protease [Steroidobacteraceae bacterium]|nr:rhomboid family intramembrane serine protease [Steroidobacteraceae bacterium]